MGMKTHTYRCLSMEKRMNKTSIEMNEVQKNLSRSINITKEIPNKINQLKQDNFILQKKNQELTDANNESKNRVASLEHKISEITLEFEKKLQSNENKLISLQRELDLSNEEIRSIKDQLKKRDDRIILLENQKNELIESLRKKGT